VIRRRVWSGETLRDQLLSANAEKAMCYARRTELRVLDVQVRGRVSTPSTLQLLVFFVCEGLDPRLTPCQSSTQTLDEKIPLLSGE